PSTSPPQTSSTGTGSPESAAATSITPNEASSAKRRRSSWAARCTAHDDNPQVQLGGVGEVFVLRKLAQRLGLDLTHALARQAELLADRLQRRRPFADEAEAELDHVALPRRKVGDRLAHREVAERRGGLLLGRRAGAGDQVAERRVAVVADRHVGRRDR